MSSAPGANGTAPAVWLSRPRAVPRAWLVFALLALLLVARRPEDFLRPQFNAEEGAIFFQQAYNEGFWSTLFSPASGYFHLALRLTAGLALLVPLELAPLVFKTVALAIHLVPVGYLLADGVPGFVVTPLFRVLVAAAYVAGPNGIETHVNVLNSQYPLALAACLILFAGPRAGVMRRTLDGGVLLLFSTSGPFAVVFTPLALWRWWRGPGDRTLNTRDFGPPLVLAGALLQVALLLAGQRTEEAARFGLPALGEVGRIIGLHGVCNSLLGMRFTLEYYEAFPSWAVLAAPALIPALAFAAAKLRNGALLVLLVLASAAVAVLFVLPLNDPRLWLSPTFGPRYFFFTTLFMVFTLLAMAERGGRWRWSALPLLAVAALGAGGDYRIPAPPDTHWPEQVAVFRSLPPGAEYFIPVYPQPTWWGLTLRRRADPAGAPVIGRYPPAGTPAAVTLDYLGSTAPSSGEVLVFAGSALDVAAGRPAGGVFLLLDGRLFPAVTGHPPPDAPSAASTPAAGFSRHVPRALLNSGTLRLQLLVLDHEGKKLLEPGPTYELTIP